MRSFLTYLCCVATAGVAIGADDVAIPGNHPLASADAGDLLVAELQCVACHNGVEPSPLWEKKAPDLALVGGRVTPDYLPRFLASPSTAHPGTTMPDVLAPHTEVERREIAEALTHFLIARSKASLATGKVESAEPEAGKVLYHTVGCVACHGPKGRARDTALAARPDADQVDDDEEEAYEDDSQPSKKAISPIAVPIEHVSKKYTAASLGDFLFQPLKIRSSGRMPDMKLTRAEAGAIATYLVGDEPVQRVAFKPAADLVRLGEKHFIEHNCAACHPLPGVEPAERVGSMQTADFSLGCLTTSPGRGPRFQLTEPQREAIKVSLTRKPTANSDDLVVAKTLTSFRCIACHVRDGYGGVPDDYNPLFVGSEPNLGDDGRIPPPLTLVGAKLQPAWMKKVLFDGESVRPYMATRMPQYGAANLGHLPPILDHLDVLEAPSMTIPPSEHRTPTEQALEKELRAGGRELLGDKGLNCIACHRFNGKPALANQGMELMTTSPRLEPGWFNRYLRNPGEFRARTIMPSAWPGGVAIHKAILDGDTDKQIAAIWYYLSLGTSAADPPGLRPVSTKITVDGRAKTYRGRSRVAGFRGIAVGLPEKISYAFNAETGTVSAIWLGEFIGVNWSGQGSGDFQPSTVPITLPQDVSFAELADKGSPWPIMPVMTKDAPTNPDPLYPKNLGYQFRGYFLDQKSIPTFQYRVGTIDVEDRSEAAGPLGQRRLERVMKLSSPANQRVWFRALTGDLRREVDGTYTNGSLRMRLARSEITLRPLGNDSEQSELLVLLAVPKGAMSLEVVYEPLSK